MNKNFLSYLLVGALCLSACSSKDEDVVNNAVITPGAIATPGNPNQEPATPNSNFPKLMSAGFAENHDADATSKSAIEGSPETSFQYLFQKGDKVRLFHLEESATYTNSSDNGTSANFELDGANSPLSKSSLAKSASNPFDGYWAVMPDNNAVDFSASLGRLLFRVPQVQTAVKNSYDPNAVVFVSVSDEAPDAFRFHALNSFMMIANDSDVEFEKIVLEGKSLAGVFLLEDFSSYEFGLSAPYSSITLNGPFEKGTNYFIALFPDFREKGYTLTGYTKDGVYEYKVENGVSFERNKIRGVKTSKLTKIDFKPELNSSAMIRAIDAGVATSITFGKKSEYILMSRLQVIMRRVCTLVFIHQQQILAFSTFSARMMMR